MKTLKLFFVLTCFMLVTLACNNQTKEVTTSSEEQTAIATQEQEKSLAMVEFSIEGMSCAMGCAKKIENKLAGLDGVTEASVDFDQKLAMVTFEKDKITTTTLEETVKSAGDSYSVKEMKTVESFSASQAKGKHVCDDTCKKEGCTAEKKKACGTNCTKACHAKKA